MSDDQKKTKKGMGIGAKIAIGVIVLGAIGGLIYSQTSGSSSSSATPPPRPTTTTTTTTTAGTTATGAASASATSTATGAGAPIVNDGGSIAIGTQGQGASLPKVFPRIPIQDAGYGDQAGRIARGYYDILGQGAANDYCRYVGDNPPFFACQLSDSSNIYAKEYKGKKVADIVATQTVSPAVQPAAPAVVPNATNCAGYDCTIEGQMCLPGTEGSSNKTWKCINKKWVEQQPPVQDSPPPPPPQAAPCIQRTGPVYLGCGKVFGSQETAKKAGCTNITSAKQFIGDSLPNKDICAVPVGTVIKTCAQYVYGDAGDCTRQCGGCSDVTWGGF